MKLELPTPYYIKTELSQKLITGLAIMSTHHYSDLGVTERKYVIEGTHQYISMRINYNTRNIEVDDVSVSFLCSHFKIPEKHIKSCIIRRFEGLINPTFKAVTIT